MLSTFYREHAFRSTNSFMPRLGEKSFKTADYVSNVVLQLSLHYFSDSALCECVFWFCFTFISHMASLKYSSESLIV